MTSVRATLRATFTLVILELNLEYIISCPKNNHLNYADKL